MISAVREYLVKDTELIGLLEGENIFFITRQEEVKVDNYVTYNYKIIGSGHVKRYQLTINFIGKDITKLLEIQERVEFLLDDYKTKKTIKDENNLLRTITLNGNGGQAFDEETKQYLLVSYFIFQI